MKELTHKGRSYQGKAIDMRQLPDASRLAVYNERLFDWEPVLETVEFIELGIRVTNP